ncbi:MAG: adenylate/guanylate cyclase domain-containing protein [Pseudolabrys sp.]
MECTACGASNSAASRTCGTCGADLVQACSKCGTLIPVSSNFCASCGTFCAPESIKKDTGRDENVLAPIHLPRHLAKRIIESRAALEGERKQITVLFADIKGSTDLIENLDPEQAELRLQPTLQAMINAVHRYEGTINRVQGDGIMALFGAPLAHEDNAVRAAYAALEMQSAVQSTSAAGSTIRVGLHAGQVIVRAIHNDLSADYDAIGPTVHLAARMEQMAEPGTIYCTASVIRLAEGFVKAKALGPVQVRGFREPIELFQIVGHTAARTRWEVTAARGLVRFVNRASELFSLRCALDLAGTGRGQVVAVTGEAGTGKSRLVHEFLQSSDVSSWTVLKATAAEFSKNTPYLSFSSLLRSWLEIADDSSSGEAKKHLRDKVTALDETLLPELPALQSLLDLPVDDTEWSMLEPAGRRQRIMAAVKNMILRAASIRPLLLWFEDLQWTDAETRTLLDHLVENIDASSLLIVATYREGYEHKWLGKESYSAIRIDPLQATHANTLVRALLGDDSKNQQLRALIVQRTGGTPLFIEETIRTLAESGALHGHAGSYSLIEELPSIKIPETVQAILATRIDRLIPEQKALLQTASVIGPVFPIALLREIADVAEPELQHLLAELQAAHFIYESPNAISSEQFRFKHTLTHEIAYGTLLSTKRRTLHAHVLHAMESLYRGKLQEFVESLAHHAINAELWDQAVMYLRQAGNRAVELSAYREASAFFEKALDALGHLPQDRDRVQQGIDIRLSLRAIFGATAEYSRLEGRLNEAEALAISIDDQRRLAAIYIAKTFAYNLRGDVKTSIQSGLRARAIAREIRDSSLTLAASYYLGQVYMWRGEFRRSLRLYEDNSALTPHQLWHQRIGTTGTSSVLWLGMVAACQAYLGNFQAAIVAGQEASNIADEVRRPYDVALAHWYAGFVYSHKGDVSAALPLLERSYEVSRSRQINFLLPVIATTLGYTYALAGRTPDGVELLAKAAASTRATKFYYAEAWATAYLGFSKLLAGRNDGIIEHALRALELARSHEYRAIEAASLRLMGDACQHGSIRDREAAERHYLEASEIAQELGLRPELAHCQRGLAQTNLKLGRTEEADHWLHMAANLYRTMDMATPDEEILGSAAP